MTQIRLDALQEPRGHVETFLATLVKHLLVRRSSREGLPPTPTNLQASIEEGDKLYATDRMRHGPDGHTPTDSGRWMYPRASDHTSPAVQRYSDGKLFWIVKNGICFSGMPAFGRVESDEHIWNLVHYGRIEDRRTDWHRRGRV